MKYHRLTLIFHGRNWAVEVKYADAPRFTRSMASAMVDLELAHLWVVYPGDRAYPLAKGVSTLPVTGIGAHWRYDGDSRVAHPT